VLFVFAYFDLVSRSESSPRSEFSSWFRFVFEQRPCRPCPIFSSPPRTSPACSLPFGSSAGFSPWLVLRPDFCRCRQKFCILPRSSFLSPQVSRFLLRIFFWPPVQIVARRSGLQSSPRFFPAAGAASPFGLVHLSFIADQPCCLVFRPAREFVGHWMSRSARSLLPWAVREFYFVPAFSLGAGGFCCSKTSSPLLGHGSSQVFG
jgi:hypothetical protein